MRAEVDTDTINAETVTKTYARWAPVYDLVFGTVFERARQAAIAATNRVGGRILDVGVGTGICLPALRPDNPRRRRRSVGADAAQGAQAGRRAGAAPCRAPGGDGRRASGVSRRVVRRGRRAIRRQHGASSGSRARRVRPRAQAGRRDHPDQPRRRRRRATAHPGTPVHARDAEARLAVGLSLGALCPLGRRDRTACASSSAARCRRSATSR